MEQKLRELQHQLYREALSLRERVIESYRLRGIPEANWGLPKLLQSIADKLNQDPADISWLAKNAWGIYHVISDSYLKGTFLGDDLYEFNDKIDEFVAMYKREK